MFIRGCLAAMEATLDSKILSALRQDDTAPTDLMLAEKLGTSRELVASRINALCRLGYSIERTPHQGYRLAEAPDFLHADDLLSLIPRHQIVGRDVQVFGETSSTNDLADRLGHDGVAEGVVIFAESQTRGRGRLGRGWFSPPGKGLWFSVLLRPDLRPQAATQLTVAAATSLVRAIRRHTGLMTDVKWPNDIFSRGKKLAGVLTEMSAEVDCVKHVVLGIGVDVNLTAEEMPADIRSIATSLRIETGQVWRRADLAAAILAELDRDYGRIRSAQFNAVAEEWESHCSTLGQQVSIRVGERLVRGRAESLDEDGALLVRTVHGHLERVIGGDVMVERTT